MINMNYLFNMFREFESVANPNTFKKIFGDVGHHLWNQFSQKCDYNLVKFTRILDEQNNTALMDYFQRPVDAKIERESLSKAK